MSDSMDFPTKQLLRIMLSPAKYLGLLQSGVVSTSAVFDPTLANREYWANIPEYLVARCPFCACTYVAQIDTYGIYGWDIGSEAYRRVYESHHQSIDCKHFVAVHSFINLNGLIPTELDYYKSEYDTPFVMPIFLPSDIPAYGVMHSLPICRIENEKFVPRYSLYCITYYSTETELLWKRRRDDPIGPLGNPIDERADVRMPSLYTNYWPRRVPDLLNLRLWVSQGKLLWLDPVTKGLPLKGNLPDEFPYYNSRGYLRSFDVRKGKLTLY